MCTGPRERAHECIETARELVERARKNIPERKDLAAEMLWDAVSLAVLDVFQRAAGLHQCATEKTCTKEDLEAMVSAAEQLIEQIKRTLGY